MVTIQNKYERIIDFIRSYTDTTAAKGYVIGVSGGKDSTIVTKLLVDAREAAKDQINLIKKEIRQIKSKIMNLEDLSIKSTESLVVGTDFLRQMSG